MERRTHCVEWTKYALDYLNLSIIFCYLFHLSQIYSHYNISKIECFKLFLTHRKSSPLQIRILRFINNRTNKSDMCHRLWTVFFSFQNLLI